MKLISSRNSEFSLSEVGVLLLLFESFPGQLELSEFLSEDSGFLLPEVFGLESLLFVVSSGFIDSLFIDDSQDFGDGLSCQLDLSQFDLRSS